MIGRIIKLVRETNNLSLDNVSKQMGVDKEILQKIENDNEGIISVKALKIIADFYDIPSYQILCIEEAAEESELTDEDIIGAISTYYMQKIDSDLLDETKPVIRS